MVTESRSRLQSDEPCSFLHVDVAHALICAEEMQDLPLSYLPGEVIEQVRGAIVVVVVYQYQDGEDDAVAGASP